MSRSWGPAFALGVAAGACAWAIHGLVFPDTPLHSDTLRDLLLARDCAQLPECAGAGPVTSFGSLRQGTSWIRLLAAARELGLPLAALAEIVRAGFAAATAMVAATLARSLGAPRAAVGALAFALFVPLAQGDPVLWNPSALALPLAGTLLGVVCFASGGAVWAAALWGFALGAALDLHVAAVAGIPPLLFAIHALAQRPALATLAALAALTSVPAAASPDAVAVAWQVTRGTALPWLGLAAAAALIAAGRAASTRLSPATFERRLLAISLAGLALAPLVLALPGVAGTPTGERYLAPFAPFAAAALALLLPTTLPEANPLRRRASLAIVALGVLLSLSPLARYLRPDADGDDAWTLAQAEQLVTTLLDATGTQEELVGRLRAPDAWLLGTLAGAVEADAAVAKLTEGDLLAIARPDARSAACEAAGFTRVPTEGPTDAFHRAIVPWTQRRHATLCLQHPGDAEPLCHTLNADSWALDACLPRVWYGSRAYLSLCDTPRPSRPGAPLTTTWKLPIHSTEPDETRVLELACGTSCEDPWLFVAADGVALDTELPARRVQIRVATGERGWILARRERDARAAHAADWSLPPDVLEWPPEWAPCLQR
jgi:hypothetical protein